MVIGAPTRLNIIPAGIMPVVHISEEDKGYERQFLIFNGSTAWNVPEGVSATIRGTKADKLGVTETATVTTGSNLVSVTITEQMTAAAGDAVYELVFVDTNGLRVASINMIWRVKKDALGDSVISESDLDYASQVLDQLQSVTAVNAQVQQNKSNISTLQTGLSAETSNRTSQDNLLQAQINQLVAPSGSAPSAAEVENARIGADGTTYDTLGNAIRGQVSDLKNDINGLESVVIDELNLTPIFSKGVFENNGYGATSSNKWVHTQVLPVGNYVITPPPNWVFEIYAYVSDTQGTAIYTLSGMQREFSTMLPIVLSGRKADNSAYTSSELETAKEEFIITVSDNPSSLQHITNSLTGIFRHSLEDANTRLTISLLQDYPSSENTGIRTYIFSVYSPTRIHVSDNSLLVRINRYSTFLSFTGNYVETLRRYALGCDYIVTSDSYPVYIAVGIRKNDLSEMTSADVETITEKLTIKAIDELNYTDISMFQTFAVAGDSWTAGTIYNIAHTAQITRTGQGWAENLARQSGIECTNYAVGGTSVRTWYNFNDGVNICGMKGLLESNAQGLYILSLGGSNDWQAGTGGARGWEIGADDPTDTTTYYMGSIADISGYNDYNDYPLTFYGYYGRIVEQIQEHAPNSRIIITSPNTYPTLSERCTACYSAVEEIAEYYGLPYMDLWKSPYYSVWKNTNLLNGLHPVASTYAGMAKAIGRLFSDVVKDNWEYFREYNGDLTTIPVTWSELVKS